MRAPADPRNPGMNLRAGDSRTAFTRQTPSVPQLCRKLPVSFTLAFLQFNNQKSYPDRKILALPTFFTFGDYVSSNSRIRLSKRRLGAKPRFSKMVRLAMEGKPTIRMSTG